MGVLPLQYLPGQSAETLGLDGTESCSISGVTALNDGVTPKTLKVVAVPTAHSAAGKEAISFEVALRIDTPGEADYYRHGGILQYVLRSLVG
jgi:aconitate hydratase